MKEFNTFLKKTQTTYQDVMDEAINLAQEAASKCIPTPMTVYGQDKEHHIEDGLCGFAWMRLPNRGKFAKWLLDEGYARKSGESGIIIWYSYLGLSSQSYARNCDGVLAVVSYFKELGIQCQFESRLD